MKFARIALVAVLSLLMVAAGRGQTAADKPVLPMKDLVRLVHTYAHVTFQQTIVRQPVVCSATAIGPHALLTASHCELPSTEILIDGDESTINGITRDDLDHTIYFVDKTFDKWAAARAEGASVGEELFMMGNPDGDLSYFRRGYISKIQHTSPAAPVEIFLDMSAYHGDSGAGLFNSKGELVTAISVVIPAFDENDKSRIQFAGAYASDFSDEQWKKAVEYDGK